MSSILKQDAQGALASLRTLRDELRVKIHLGGMEARRKFEELERDFDRIQSAAKHEADASVEDLKESFLELKASLKSTFRGKRRK
jgi:archaellum component FlaC